MKFLTEIDTEKYTEFVKNHKLEKIKNTPKVDKYDLFVYNENYISK